MSVLEELIPTGLLLVFLLFRLGWLLLIEQTNSNKTDEAASP